MTDKTQNDEFDIDTPLGMAQAVNWMLGFIKHIKEGGTWLIPRSGTVYEVRHSQKVAIKVMQMLPDPALDKVFRAAGWKVVDNT